MINLVFIQDNNELAVEKNNVELYAYRVLYMNKTLKDYHF